MPLAVGDGGGGGGGGGGGLTGRGGGGDGKGGGGIQPAAACLPRCHESPSASHVQSEHGPRGRGAVGTGRLPDADRASAPVQQRRCERPISRTAGSWSRLSSGNHGERTCEPDVLV